MLLTRAALRVLMNTPIFEAARFAGTAVTSWSVRVGMVYGLSIALFGCGNGTDGESRGRANVATARAVEVSSEPSVVELKQATAVLDDLGIVRFTIDYAFTAGAPTKFYQCDITFVDADRYGIKPMTASELSPTGTINTGIEVGDAPVNEYTITLSEAESPDRGYTVISNTLRGVVDTSRVAMEAETGMNDTETRDGA